MSHVLVAIPSYGHNDLTRQAVADCLREAVAVLVIDNQGTYSPIADEMVWTPTENGGWGGACEWAMNHFLHTRAGHSIILLNNDVRLSENFCGGLLVTALKYPNAGIVTALYSHGNFEQTDWDGFCGPASQYQPKAECWEIGQADGTCVLITRECLEKIGTFDLSVSPQYGWGLMPDLCIRARQAGFKVLATAASYCEHLEDGGAITAISVHGDKATYRKLGKKEMLDGLRRKWGPDYGWLLLDDESKQDTEMVINLGDDDTCHVSRKLGADMVTIPKATNLDSSALPLVTSQTA